MQGAGRGLRACCRWVPHPCAWHPAHCLLPRNPRSTLQAAQGLMAAHLARQLSPALSVQEEEGARERARETVEWFGL